MRKFMDYLKTLNLVRKLKLKKLTAPVFYFLIAMIFISINILVSPFALRFDASFGKAYTLSPSTKKIIRNLDDIVTIKFFASSDLPTRLIPLKNQVTDLLNEYSKENKGRMIVKVLDPKKDQNAINDAKENGIPALQFSQLEQDKYAVTSSYFGMVIAYGGKKEILPQVTDIDSLEYNLTASVYKLTRKEAIKVGIMGKTESANPQTDELASFNSVMKQQFEINYIDISSKSETKTIDPSMKAVIIFDDNNKTYDEQEIKELKKYINNKGKVIVFVDGVWVGADLTTNPAKHNLSVLLNEYGININNDMVLSTSAELVNFGNNVVSFFSPYPFWIKTTEFNQKISYFSNVNQLTFPWVSSLNIQGKSDVQVTGLVKSSSRSWVQKDNFVLDPQNIPQPSAKDLKQYTVAAEAKEKSGGKLLVIPSSRFILERFLTRTSNNIEFVLNVINDYASEGALSGIRQRSISFYPLPDLPENQKDIFKYANILLLPVLLGIFGALRLMRRK